MFKGVVFAWMITACAFILNCYLQCFGLSIPGELNKYVLCLDIKALMVFQLFPVDM